MWKAGIAGALALATVGSSLALTTASEARNSFRPASGIVLTEGHIARLKAALKLTAAQEKYWPAVAAALHSIVRARHEQPASPEAYQLASSTPPTTTVDSAKVQRVAAAAMPLIMLLSEEQKRQAARFARSLGLESVASAF